MKNTVISKRKLTELQLYQLLKEGDPASIEHIHSRYKRLLFWIGIRMIEDDFVVETLVQDVFLKLWLKRDTIETPDHIINFLRFVMRRDCMSYFSAPRNKFNRSVNSLEKYENYQDYLAGYDPLQDEENLLHHAADQRNFEEVQKVLSVLNPKRKHLIKLCLEYGFQYKPIAVAMGSSVKDISNEVHKAIADLRSILRVNSLELIPEKTSEKVPQVENLSTQQLEIVKRRFEEHSSFAVIAKALELTEKEVRRDFLYAYQYLQTQNTSAKTL